MFAGLFSCQVVFGQYFNEIHFNSQNGFGANTVYAIAQDRLGFIWIGTNKGLFRYDGSAYEHFGFDDGLVDEDIFGIRIDKGDHIYLHNFTNRVNYYYRGTFSSAATDSTLSDMHMNSIPTQEYYEAYDAFIVSGAGANSFYYLKFESGKVVEKKELFLSKGNFGAVMDHGELLYVFYTDEAGNYEYNIYKADSLVLSGIKMDGFSYARCHDKGSILFFDIYSNSVIRYQPDDKGILEQVKEIPLGRKTVNIFTLDTEVWATFAEGGVGRIENGSVVEHYLPDQTINTIFRDRQGNLWIGTNANGIFFYREHNMLNLSKAEIGISKNVNTLNISTANESVLVGFDKLAVKEFANSGTIIKSYFLTSKEVPENRRVTAIETVDSDRIIGTDVGLFYIDREDRYQTLAELSIKCIIPSNDGFYVGSSTKLEYYSPGNNTWHTDTIFNNRTVAVSATDDNTVLIGTVHGLFLKKAQGDVVPFPIPELRNILINDIDYYQGNIFTATNKGVCLLSKFPTNTELFWITKSDGLISNRCRKLTVYKNRLLIATDNGISIVRLNQNFDSIVDIKNYSTYEGLPSNDVNDLVVFQDSVWAATVEGLSIFPLDLDNSPSSVTTNITRARTSLQEHNIHDKILLYPNDNNISISYSAMKFGNISKPNYSYRLLPNDVKWQRTDENVITYSELSPGDYTFEVKEDNGRGEIKSPATRLHFSVVPKFSQTIYFEALMLLLALGLVGIVFYWRDRETKRRLNFEKTIASLELEAIKAQINPHFIYNSLNSIKSTIVKGDNRIAEDQLTIFAKLVRQTLKISQQDFITIAQEIEYLNLYTMIEKIRFGDKLQCELNSTIEKDRPIKIPTMLVQPYVENAIKYSMGANEDGTATVHIDFRCHNNRMSCSIEDNGPGMSSKKHSDDHDSQGMLLSSTRAQIYNNLYDMDIAISVEGRKDRNGKKCGTIVHIQYPL